jgi:acyl-CoA reductase-like NAD-dependent aldehyde dehydrogenase
MTAHPVPRMVDFTGSVRTGKLVAAGAAPDLKRVALELGGNDAAIALDDADPAKLADPVFWAAFANCGQVCIAIKRLYVPRERHDDWVDAMTATAEAVEVGPGLEEGVRMGPLNNRPQRDHVESLVDDAVRGGATATTGGSAIDGPGNFYSPTIISGAGDGTRIVDDEQFGPALPVIPYDSVDAVVDAANATHYGLGGSVWGEDVDRAAAVAGRLDSGTVWVNTHRVLAAHIPFAGHKWSGYGGNAGIEGFHEFTEGQVIYTKH